MRQAGVTAVVFFSTILNRSAVVASIEGFVWKVWIEGRVDHVQKENADEEDYRDSQVTG